MMGLVLVYIYIDRQIDRYCRCFWAGTGVPYSRLLTSIEFVVAMQMPRFPQVTASQILPKQGFSLQL